MRVDPDTCRDPDLLADEVRRLRSIIDTAMRSMPHVGPAPVEGPRTASVTEVVGAGPTLTHAEREAIERAIAELDEIMQEFIPTPVEMRLQRHVSTLRGLLERTQCYV
jgi:hypothetical protein